MAIEDAVTLAACLDRAKITDEIPQYLRAYQKIRQPRCKIVQEFGSIQAKRATLLDGPEQQERDKRFKTHNAFAAQKTWDGVHVDEVPGSINSPDWMPWLLGHDAVAFVSHF
jgi:salicylate hydroxylase